MPRTSPAGSSSAWDGAARLLPGTGAAALGQGNYDALAGIAGLMAGSYLYAETSDFLSATIQKIGNRGGIMLPDLVGMRLIVFLAIFVPVLGFALFVLDRATL